MTQPKLLPYASWRALDCIDQMLAWAHAHGLTDHTLLAVKLLNLASWYDLVDGDLDLNDLHVHVLLGLHWQDGERAYGPDGLWLKDDLHVDCRTVPPCVLAFVEYEQRRRRGAG